MGVTCRYIIHVHIHYTNRKKKKVQIQLLPVMNLSLPNVPSKKAWQCHPPVLLLDMKNRATLRDLHTYRGVNSIIAKAITPILQDTTVVYTGKPSTDVHSLGAWLAICFQGYFGISLPGSKERRGLSLISEKYLASPPIWQVCIVICVLQIPFGINIPLHPLH